MKEFIVNKIREISSDKRMMYTLVALLVTSISLIIFTSLGLHYRETPVVTHYTSYGSQHLYDNSWYDTLTFIFFAVCVLIGHSALIIKIKNKISSDMVVIFGVMSVIVLAIAFVIAHQVLRVAVL